MHTIYYSTIAQTFKPESHKYFRYSTASHLPTADQSYTLLKRPIIKNQGIFRMLYITDNNCKRKTSQYNQLVCSGRSIVNWSRFLYADDGRRRSRRVFYFLLDGRNVISCIMRGLLMKFERSLHVLTRERVESETNCLIRLVWKRNHGDSPCTSCSQLADGYQNECEMI